jgi:formylglycine-generating enzyme
MAPDVNRCDLAMTNRPAIRHGWWGRAAAFITVVTTFPAISAASLSTMSSPTPAQPTFTIPLVELGPGNGCPSNMARVGANCVDKYEDSLVQIRDDGTEAPWSPYQAPNGHRVRAVSRRGVVPQAHISMREAKVACNASGKRLCRADEWKAACKGPEATRYPYGNTRVPGACVDTNRTSPMAVLHEGEHTALTMNDPLANQQPNTVEPTGAAASCTNGYGVYDMVGNVHEWTDDASFRGGYYLDTVENGEGCDYRTTAHAPEYYDYSTGFRCCSDADSLDEDDI